MNFARRSFQPNVRWSLARFTEFDGCHHGAEGDKRGQRPGVRSGIAEVDLYVFRAVKNFWLEFVVRETDTCENCCEF